MADSPTVRDPQEALRALFAAHGLDATIEQAWVRLPRGCRARAVFHARPESPTIQLDVVFEPWVGQPIVESCAGVGDGRAAQEADAWAAFASGSLHVLLAAFLYLEDVPVHRTAWEVDGSTRAVTIGDTLTRGTPPAHGGWRGALQAFVEQSELPEGTHWIRLFYGQHDGELLACEVLLDNEPWDEARAAMEAFAWPPTPEFYSVRQFLVVQGGLDVSRGVACFVEHPASSDDEVAEELMKRGVAPDDAELLAAYIPLAFGRVMVGHLPLSFAPVAELHPRSGGEPRTVTLERDPVFTEAAWLADRAMTRGTLTREQFLSIAARSPELDALNQALHAGAKPEDLVFSPPVIPVAS